MNKNKPKKLKSFLLNGKECYLVVDKDEKVVAKFRHRFVAKNFANKRSRQMFGDKFEVVYDPNLP